MEAEAAGEAEDAVFCEAAGSKKVVPRVGAPSKEESLQSDPSFPLADLQKADPLAGLVHRLLDSHQANQDGLQLMREDLDAHLQADQGEDPPSAITAIMTGMTIGDGEGALPLALLQP